MVTIVLFFSCYNFFMNNRDYKEFAKDEIYHIYNRGVSKMDIFIDEQDFKVFLSRLKENLFSELIDYSLLPKQVIRRKVLPPNSYDLISYCLMPNHFHILIKQNTNLSISKIILKVFTGYSKYFNKKYGRVGPIFQDSFKAVRIHKNNQLLWVSYYIHKNPIEAKIVKNIKDYKWNSYLEYVGLTSDPICKKDLILGQFQKSDNYHGYFKSNKYDKEVQTQLISHQDLLIDPE